MLMPTLACISLSLVEGRHFQRSNVDAAVRSIANEKNISLVRPYTRLLYTIPYATYDFLNLQNVSHYNDNSRTVISNVAKLDEYA